MPIVVCEVCQAEYHVKPSKQSSTRFCSRECMNTSQRRQVTKTCEFCGDTYQKRRSRASESRFCSRTCKDTHKREQPPPTVSVQCCFCREWIEREPYEASSNSRFYCGIECRGKWVSENKSGENNPNWKGGPTHAFGENWLAVRRRVLERDVVCQACGEDGNERLLDVHHIVPRSEFDEVEQSNTMLNLVVLCRRCHKLAEEDSIPCPHPVGNKTALEHKIQKLLQRLPSRRP